MQPADRPTLERYAALVTELLVPAAAPAPTCEDASTVQVERGSVLPMSLAGARDGQIVRAVAELLVATPPTSATRVVDAGGHYRPAYRGLLVYAWQRALSMVEDRLPLQRARAWNARVREWCVLLHADLAAAGLASGAESARSASAGAETAGQAWAALALQAAGYGDVAGPVFSRLIDGQQQSGAFFTPDASDNPETRWYHELVLLHACSSYAVLTGDPRAAQAAARAARYHVSETQPDHATSQPWGLPAFILSDAARPLADEVLHAVRIRQAEGPDGVTQILLADTLLGLRRLMAQ